MAVGFMLVSGCSLIQFPLHGGVASQECSCPAPAHCRIFKTPFAFLPLTIGVSLSFAAISGRVTTSEPLDFMQRSFLAIMAFFLAYVNSLALRLMHIYSKVLEICCVTPTTKSQSLSNFGG